MTLLLGDSLNILKDINNESIDLIVTDPPYGIEFMGKDWDRALPSIDIWKECFRVLKEGKLAFVMCSPRQDVLSRMIISLEDAGFRTNYTSLYWTYSSGFPKAANVSKLIDKRNGAEPIKTRLKSDPRYKSGSNTIAWREKENRKDDNKFGNFAPNSIYETKPATEEAKKYEGAYVGFQPKPAVEIILVVSKGKTLTWLDDCRIPYQSEDDINNSKPWSENGHIGFGSLGGKQLTDGDGNNTNEKGRFPANLLCGTFIDYNIDDLLELQEELKNAKW